MSPLIFGGGKQGILFVHLSLCSLLFWGKLEVTHWTKGKEDEGRKWAAWGRPIVLHRETGQFPGNRFGLSI